MRVLVELSGFGQIKESFIIKKDSFAKMEAS